MESWMHQMAKAQIDLESKMNVLANELISKVFCKQSTLGHEVGLIFCR